MDQTPYQNMATSLGTAPALANIDLEDSIPVAENPFEVNRELTRWLFFPGDVLVPSQKRERPDLRSGGEYYGQNFKTLVRSKGLLRRCQITPLEIGFDFMSNDMIGDDANIHVVTSVSHNDPMRGAMQGVAVGGINGVKMYPGDEIKGILLAERNNTSKGVVELEQLAGVEFSEFKASGLQEFVFPDWAKIVAGVPEFALPKKISELEKHLTSRKRETGERSIQDVIDAMLSACEQYRVWGTNYVKFASQLVRLPAQGGHLFTYGELAEMLFEQLEIRREDLISTDRDIADIVARASQGNGASSGEVTALLAKMTQLLEISMKGGATVPPVEVVSEVKVEGEKCGAPTAGGEPCGNVYGKCRHHPLENNG